MYNKPFPTGYSFLELPTKEILHELRAMVNVVEGWGAATMLDNLETNVDSSRAIWLLTSSYPNTKESLEKVLTKKMNVYQAKMYEAKATDDALEYDRAERVRDQLEQLKNAIHRTRYQSKRNK